MDCVLITGGTGLVGKALTNYLLKENYKVIILTRQVLQNNNAKQPSLSYAKWNIDKQEIDIEALKTADYIIHLAGANVMEKKWTNQFKQEIIMSRVISSNLIVNALQKNTNKVKAIISASAIGYYNSSNIIHTEYESVDTSFLGSTCKLWEQSMQAVQTLNKRLVIFRIGIVLSPNGGALKEFMKPLKFKIATVFGKQTISWIAIDDLCSMFLFALKNKNINGVYNTVAPTLINNKSLVLRLAKTISPKFYIPIKVPHFILKIMLGERSIEIIKSCSVSCKKIMDAGFVYTFDTVEKYFDSLFKK